MKEIEVTDPLPADDLTRTPISAVIQNRWLAQEAHPSRSYKVLISGNETEGRYCLIELVVPPGNGPPMHRHDFEEMFILLKGEMEFVIRGNAQVVRAPHALNVPANAPHRFSNTSKEPVHLLCMCTPAGIEEYFEVLGERSEAERSGVTDLASADLMKISGKELALRYRMERVED